jgi:DNA-binding transcriptional ArsR family regulator
MAVGGESASPPRSTTSMLHLTDRVAERRLEIIRPLVGVGRGSAALMDSIARQAGVSSRTIYRWLRFFRHGGLTALRWQKRRDRNLPTVVTLAALEFLLDAMQSPNTKSVRWIYRAYRQERWLRRCDGAVEQFPPVSYETVRKWVKGGSISFAILRLRRSMSA